MPNCFLGLGSNLGDRMGCIQSACVQIAQKCGKIVAQSSVYETSPWGYIPQPLYLNQVIQIHTTLTPKQLLKVCKEIENSELRTRFVRWDSRTLDIDILLYDQEIHTTSENLLIPHPRIQERKFVLVPLVEIAPNVVHPQLKKSMKELLENCEDTLSVMKYSN